MRDNKYVNVITQHIQNNFWLYIVSLLFLCTGIVLGIYAMKYMSEVDKLDLSNYFNSFIEILTSKEINNKSIFFEAIKNNVSMIFLIFFLGITFVGLPLILLINLIKGFTIGFTISFAIDMLGGKGLVLALIGVIPQNIIYIPCIMGASVISMRTSLDKMKNNLFGKKSYAISENKNMIVSIATIILIVSLGILMESYVTPSILKYLLQ
ncbi:stage II sporulation protein M [Clostridium algidicarnis]|mgnify:CR=1 FL=1|uniref:stage II sporulation protein M n=1 Tax=Clostridium algidicarnis TaxID=37659 RepID=UPI001627B0E7|nr:stage II sporulation protein M [Clostridium algidicarnis]MBB6631293.1 stage II sporulation protein M [Clostridium algidicarnis]MBB6697588.1 stage II sporulation protein M [Clostridium algidicarnis]MBU3193795.1 stage II sporulation protein M [Clostridium algidicarnis]MBU3203324.1 stage II sporulation protein M [Clostridium algidicarnis]MBU3205381.1 stage II sporulation protein M [Clostridium algidicarnis]